MAAYATVEDVQKRMTREMSEREEAVCEQLLGDAGVIIDSYNKSAAADAKKVVSCRMVLRALGDGSDGGAYPLGSTQGSMTALGYTQSWTMGSGGASGELYLGKIEKKLLGVGDAVGAFSPVEKLDPWYWISKAVAEEQSAQSTGATP